MRKLLIVGNWKANPESVREARKIAGPVKRAAAKLLRVEAVICPPAVFLSPLGDRVSKLAFGAQNCFWETAGAYTGQIGPSMLRNSGASFLLLGHSEARRFGDSDEIIARKLRAALKYDWRIILGVGEETRDESGEYLQVIKRQLETALRGMPRKFFERLIIAYEPVWAIGEGAKQSDTPAGFLEQAIYIRRILSGLIGKEVALALPILYGGSVTAANAANFLAEGRADGLLVGRASLEAAEFIKILRLANDATKND